MGDNDDEDDEAAEHRQKRKSKESHTATNNQTKDDPKQRHENQGDNDSPPQPGHELTLPRIFTNCTAFICVILIFVGELMSEENLRAVLCVGGGLTVANILYTSVDLDRWYSTKNEDQQDDDCLPIIDKRSEVQQTVRFNDLDMNKKASSKARGHRKTDARKDHDVISYDDSNISSGQMTSGPRQQQRNLPQKQSKRERGGVNRDEKSKRLRLPPGAVVIDMEYDSPKRDTGLNAPIRSNSRSRRRPSEPNVVQNDREKNSLRATDRRSTRVREHITAEHSYTPAPAPTEGIVKPRSRSDHHPRGRRTVHDKSGTRRPERERDRGHDRDEEKRKRSGCNQTNGRDRRNANGVIKV